MFNGTTAEDLERLMQKGKQVVYKGMWFATNSDGYSLWEAMQKETDPKKKAELQKKLDAHVKDVETRAKELVDRYK